MKIVRASRTQTVSPFGEWSDFSLFYLESRLSAALLFPADPSSLVYTASDGTKSRSLPLQNAVFAARNTSQFRNRACVYHFLWVLTFP
jgi:hypothetical protein